MPRGGNEIAGRFAGEDPKFFALEKFEGLNTKAQRPAIKDQQFYWLENMIPLGDGNLRSTPTNGTTAYTASGGTTVVYKFFYNIGTSNYAAIFLSDGTAYQVNLTTLVQTTISNVAGTFYPGSASLNNPVPAAAQYGNSGIVIAATSATNGYWAWDGSTLYSPGQASPTWLNGGTPTNMPTGVAGTSVETFQSRVWITNGPICLFSAPSNGASFSGNLGGGSFTSTDSFLRREYTVVRQANGFLYVFGDSSINVISNVQSSGSPVVTTFNNTNVDPQVGTPWHNSVVAYGRGLVFANQTGVYALYGGAAEKISDDLDGLFAAAQTLLNTDTSTLQPSAAIATIYGIKVFLLVMHVKDPFTGNFRNVVVAWDGKKWFMASQDRSLVRIAVQEINSYMTAWGTDGTLVYPMFQTTSTTLKKIIQTKFWQGDGFVVTKQVMRAYMQAEDNAGSGYSITGTIDQQSENQSNTTAITFTSNTNALGFINNVNAQIGFVNASSAVIGFVTVGLTLNGQNTTGTGALIGATLSSTSADFTIISMAILYRELSPFGG